MHFKTDLFVGWGSEAEASHTELKQSFPWEALKQQFVFFFSTWCWLQKGQQPSRLSHKQLQPFKRKEAAAACSCLIWRSAGGSRGLEAVQKDISCSISMLKTLIGSKRSLSKFQPHMSNFGNTVIIIRWWLCKMRKKLTGLRWGAPYIWKTEHAMQHGL